MAKRKGISYSFLGFILGFLLSIIILFALYRFAQEQNPQITSPLYFLDEDAPFRVLMLILLIYSPLAGFLLGRERERSERLKRVSRELLGKQQKLISAEKKIAQERDKLRSLLSQESDSFVGNWSEMVTEKEKLREESEISSALLKVAKAVGGLAEPHQVLEILTKVTPSVIPCDECFTLLWNRQKKLFFIESFLGNSAILKGFSFNPQTFPALKELLKRKVPLMIEEAKESELLPKDFMEKLNVKSALFIPFVSRQEVLAVLLALFTRSDYKLGSREIGITSGIVNQATVALENAQLYQETVAKKKELQRLTRRLESDIEEERRRISRDLHDGVVQNLSGMNFNLSFLEKALEEKKEKAEEEIKQLEGVVEATIADLRKVIYDLRPTTLDSLGLLPTLETHLKRFSEQEKIKVDYQASLEKRLPKRVETSLFRLTQEALNNIKKHAQASNVKIALENVNGKVSLVVEDNGKGFDVEAVKARFTTDSGFGLLGMRERVEALGGTLEISSNPGKGTRLAFLLKTDAKEIVNE